MHDATAASGPGLKFSLGGDVVDVAETPYGGPTEGIGILAAAIVLLIAFGSLVAAGLPLAMALIGLGISSGLIALLANVVDVPDWTTAVSGLIGIGVGIDYSLFVLTRFRTELKKSGDVPDALGNAMATSGKAVLVSALTVFVALSGTLLVNIAAFRSMGLGAMVTVLLAGVGALTLLPAVLGALGPRIDKWSVHRRTTDASSGLWHRWATTVMPSSGPTREMPRSAPSLFASGSRPGRYMTTLRP